MVLSPPCSFRTPEVWATGRSRCHHTFAANRGLLPCCSLGSVFTTGLCATLTTEGAALSSTGARRYSVPSPQAVTSLSRLNPPPQTLSTAEEETTDRRSRAILRPATPTGCSASSSVEDARVGVERRLPAQVGVEDGGILRDLARADQVDQSSHGLPLVDGVDDHALERAAQPDGFDRRLDRDAVEVPSPTLEDGDLVVSQIPAELDELACAAGDPSNLVAGLLQRRGRVDAEDPPGATMGALLQGREAGDHARVGGAGHRAHDDRVEEDTELPLLLRDLEGPVGEAESTERVLGRTGRDAVGRAAGFLDITHGFLPGAADADVEAARVEAHVGAHDA